MTDVAYPDRAEERRGAMRHLRDLGVEVDWRGLWGLLGCDRYDLNTVSTHVRHSGQTSLTVEITAYHKDGPVSADPDAFNELFDLLITSTGTQILPDVPDPYWRRLVVSLEGVIPAPR